MGSLFFDIYINDIVSSVQHLQALLFTDDRCFYALGSDLLQLINIVNISLNDIYNWVLANKLTLNMSKSHYIIFNRNLPLPSDLLQLKINNINISRVDNTKFLGIILQSNLKWNLHIQSVTDKINKYSAILYQIRNYLDKFSLKIVYNSLVYNNINYMNVIWGKSPETHLDQLIKAQKRILRTIMYRSRYHHTNNDFYNLGILKVPNINIYFSCIFVYKSLNNLFHPRHINRSTIISEKPVASVIL